VVDVQVIAASHHDLGVRVADGGFRDDLYHRLSVFRLDLPPLRARIEDLDDLVPLFIAELNASAGKRVRVVPVEAWDEMRRYHWPGNVRELRNAVERCVLLSDSEVFPTQWLQLPDTNRPVADGGDDWLRLPLDGSLGLDDMERRILELALAKTDRNVTAAARLLGTTRQTLRYRVAKHGLDAGPEDED